MPQSPVHNLIVDKLCACLNAWSFEWNPTDYWCYFIVSYGLLDNFLGSTGVLQRFTWSSKEGFTITRESSISFFSEILTPKCLFDGFNMFLIWLNDLWGVSFYYVCFIQDTCYSEDFLVSPQLCCTVLYLQLQVASPFLLDFLDYSFFKLLLPINSYFFPLPPSLCVIESYCFIT